MQAAAPGGEATAADAATDPGSRQMSTGESTADVRATKSAADVAAAKATTAETAHVATAEAATAEVAAAAEAAATMTATTAAATTGECVGLNRGHPQSDDRKNDTHLAQHDILHHGHTARPFLSYCRHIARPRVGRIKR
jgi:hypothetical protein